MEKALPRLFLNRFFVRLDFELALNTSPHLEKNQRNAFELMVSRSVTMHLR